MSFALRRNGIDYTEWQSASLTRSIEQPAAKFSFSAPHPQQKLEVKVQDKIEIDVDGREAVKGKIFGISGRSGQNDATRTFNGRSSLADAIDSSVPLQPGLWENITSKQIIEQLLKPYPINTDFQINPVTITSLRTNPGDRVWESIYKLLQKENLLAYELQAGILTFDRAPESGSVATLRFGTQQITEMTDYNLDITNRFHKYTAVGEGILGGEMQAQGIAFDEFIDKSREEVIQLSGNVTNTDCQKAADYEAAVRAARSLGFSYRVPSWYNENEELWLPNQRVNIEDDENDINGEHLLTTVTLNETEEDEWAVLKFAPPESYTLKPPQQPASDNMFGV